MEHIGPVDVRVLLLAPPNDGALGTAARQTLTRLWQAGHAWVRALALAEAIPTLRGDPEQRHVIVNRVGIVVWVQDGVLHKVLTFRSLQKDQEKSVQ